MTNDEMAALVAGDDAAEMRQRVAEIAEEIRAARETHGHTQDCDDLRDEARELWTDIRKLEGNNQ